MRLKVIEVQADQESKINERVWDKEEASWHQSDSENVVVAGCEMLEAISYSMCFVHLICKIHRDCFEFFSAKFGFCNKAIKNSCIP